MSPHVPGVSADAPEEALDLPPPPANVVSVAGDGALLEVGFFYLSPSKLAQAAAPSSASGETTEPAADLPADLTLRATPVARVALPITAAAELVLALIERIDDAIPEMRETLSEFAARLHELSGGEAPADEIELTVADEGARRRKR